MATQKFAAPTNKDGEVVDLNNEVTNGDVGRYALVEPAYYLAVVDGLKPETFQSKDKSRTFMKVIPQFQLLNPAQTLINRQDFIVGYINEEKELWHPDGEFPIWAGATGARFLFKSLGMFRQEAGEVELEFYPHFVTDRVIRVRTGIAGYIKGNWELSKKVATADAFNEMALDAIGRMTNGAVSMWTLQDIPNIIRWFNTENGLADADGVPFDEDKVLRTKNVVVAVYPPNKYEIEEHGFYLDDHMQAVYLTEASYNEYRRKINTGVTVDENNEPSKDATGW